MALTLAPVQTAVTVHSTLTDSHTALRAGDVVATVLDGQGGVQLSISSTEYWQDGQAILASESTGFTVAGNSLAEGNYSGAGLVLTDTIITFAAAQYGGSAIVFDSSP